MLATKIISRASEVAQWYRICLPMQESQVGPLGQEDPLEKDVATHFSILAWEIPWTEELGGLQFRGLQRDCLSSTEYSFLL